MKDQGLVPIVKLCVHLDMKAVEIYTHLSKLTKDGELKKFWIDMVREEKEHVRFWNRVLRLAEKEKLPQIFNDPGKAKRELETLDKKVDSLMEQCEASPDEACAFLLAYRLESHLIHFVFETFFILMKAMSDEKNPGDTYEDHINRFVTMLLKYGGDIPEIDILGETLQRLWKKNRELARQSTLDELTGIFNRRGFAEAANPLAHLARRNGYHVAVLMADIDDFKEINDRYGHGQGDDVLKSVSRILASCTRASDIIARHGGEEFVIFFSNIKKNALAGMAEKIRKNVARETKKSLPVTVSIGAAGGVLKKDAEQEMLTLINRADACLYEAKRTGKNRVVIHMPRKAAKK
jgi:diguanylate cyclase (GGDEF)-like protein